MMCCKTYCQYHFVVLHYFTIPPHVLDHLGLSVHLLIWLPINQWPHVCFPGSWFDIFVLPIPEPSWMSDRISCFFLVIASRLPLTGAITRHSLFWINRLSSAYAAALLHQCSFPHYLYIYIKSNICVVPAHCYPAHGSCWPSKAPPVNQCWHQHNLTMIIYFTRIPYLLFLFWQ